MNICPIMRTQKNTELLKRFPRNSRVVLTFVETSQFRLKSAKRNECFTWRPIHISADISTVNKLHTNWSENPFKKEL
jgi:hypothetical protein